MTKDTFSPRSPHGVARLGVMLLLIPAIQAALPTTALGQGRPDSTARAAARPADTSRVSLSPAQPTQGSIIQIRLRPPMLEMPADAVAPPPARTDTSAGGAAWTIPRPDGARPDSLGRLHPNVPHPAPDSAAATRPDSGRSAGIIADSLRGRVIRISAMLFGEPLHFVPGDSGSHVAIGGIPVDAPRSVRVPVVVDRFGAPSDTVYVELEIARSDYKMEKLTVAPQFGRAPDSALAARMAREAALAAAVSRRSHDVPSLWTGPFARPRPSRVTSAFGDGREFNGRVQSRHMGLDLAGAVGTPVLAAGRGVVALVGDFYLAGNAVYLDHGGGLVTAYFHLSAVDVAAGDTVNAGDPIGKVGATGRVTGPHLHWVARYGSVTIDPSTLLELSPARREP